MSVLRAMLHVLSSRCRFCARSARRDYCCGDPARCDYVAVVGCGNVRVSSVVGIFAKPKLSLLYDVRGRLHMAAFVMPLLLVAESGETHNNRRTHQKLADLEFERRRTSAAQVSPSCS